MGNLSSKRNQNVERREEIPLPSPEEGTMICGVVKQLGGGYLLVKCLDGADRKARIPGKMRRKIWITEGDIVLVGLWDHTSDKADVIHRYERSEIAELVEKGVVPKEFIDAISELI
ncbi:MAG: translation initiation factor aIF-1A [Desulfurococcus sp.]|nr:translation initiation factor aIF-1A [Desulfurococcus sp.]